MHSADPDTWHACYGTHGTCTLGTDQGFSIDPADCENKALATIRTRSPHKRRLLRLITALAVGSSELDTLIATYTALLLS